MRSGQGTSHQLPLQAALPKKHQDQKSCCSNQSRRRLEHCREKNLPLQTFCCLDQTQKKLLHHQNKALEVPDGLVPFVSFQQEPRCTVSFEEALEEFWQVCWSSGGTRLAYSLVMSLHWELPYWKGTGFQQKDLLHAAGMPEDGVGLEAEGLIQQQVQSAVCRDICSLDRFKENVS